MHGTYALSTDYNLTVRAKANIHGNQQWFNSPITKKLFARHFPQAKQFMPNPLQFLNISLLTIIHNTRQNISFLLCSV